MLLISLIPSVYIIIYKLQYYLVLAKQFDWPYYKGYLNENQACLSTVLAPGRRFGELNRHLIGQLNAWRDRALGWRLSDSLPMLVVQTRFPRHQNDVTNSLCSPLNYYQGLLEFWWLGESGSVMRKFLRDRAMEFVTPPFHIKICFLNRLEHHRQSGLLLKCSQSKFPCHAFQDFYLLICCIPEQRGLTLN